MIFSCFCKPGMRILGWGFSYGTKSCWYPDCILIGGSLASSSVMGGILNVLDGNNPWLKNALSIVSVGNERYINGEWIL